MSVYTQIPAGGSQTDGLVALHERPSPSLPQTSIYRTLKLSVNVLCASLNSGVENDKRGSSLRRMA